MENRKSRTTRFALVSTVALVAFSLIAIPAAEARPVRQAPPPPAARARPARPVVRVVPTPVARASPAPPVVRVRPMPMPVRVVTPPATVRADVAARARARLAALRAQLVLTDMQCATLEPFFVQAYWQAQTIQAQGAMTPVRQQSLRAVWKGLGTRVQSHLTVPQRARFAQVRGAQRAHQGNGQTSRNGNGSQRNGAERRQGVDRTGGRDQRGGSARSDRNGRNDRDGRNDRNGRNGGQGNGRSSHRN